MNIETERLLLREWRDEDLLPFFHINQDSKVTEFLRKKYSLEETREFIERIKKHFKNHGFGLWAVILKETGEFIGYIGLAAPTFQAPFTPCFEIGWRLGSQYWGKGYATEGAKAVRDAAFNVFQLDEIVSFTVPENKRSIRVMEKIGMKHNPADDFRHPSLPLNHRLSAHVLYRLKKSDLPHA